MPQQFWGQFVDEEDLDTWLENLEPDKIDIINKNADNIGLLTKLKQEDNLDVDDAAKALEIGP